MRIECFIHIFAIMLGIFFLFTATVGGYPWIGFTGVIGIVGAICGLIWFRR